MMRSFVQLKSVIISSWFIVLPLTAQASTDAGSNQPTLEQSFQLLEDRLQSDPQNPLIHYQLGLIHEARRDYVQAIEAYWTAVNLDRTKEEYSLALASLFFEIDNDNKAIEVIDAYLEVNPNSVPCLSLLGTIQLMSSRYAQLLPLAKKVIGLNPSYPYGHFLLGLAHKGKHQPEKARKAFERTISLNPAFADAYLELGLLESKEQESFPKAAEHLRKAISLGLNRKEVYKDLGSVLLKLGENDEAVRRLEEALTIDPDYAEAYYLLAGAYRKMGDVDRSAAALQKFQALSREERSTVAVELKGEEHFTAGLDLLDRKETDKAYASFSKAIEALPDKHLAYYHLAVIDLLRGDYQKAQSRIRRAIDLYPWKSEYYFVLAQCLQSEDPAKAAEAVRKAISLEPRQVEYKNLLGNLLLMQEDYQGAIRAYRSAIAVDPNRPFVHLNLSAALRKIGELEKAEEEAKRYQELAAQGRQE